MSLAKIYQRKLYKHYQMLPVWSPGKPLKLGDIIQKERGIYVRTSSLADRASSVTFKERTDPGESEEEYDDKGSVVVTFKAKGKAQIPNTSIAVEDAGAVVEFKSENSVYLKMLGISYNSIEDQIGLGKQITELYKNGQWDKDYYIVTEVATCKSATIILSTDKNAKIEVTASAKGEIGGINLADADLGLTVGTSRGIGHKILAEKDLQVLYRVSGVKDSLFSETNFGPHRKNFKIAITPAMVAKKPDLVEFNHLNADDLFLEDDSDDYFGSLLV